ncbi:AraC family transcriptional regulator [Rhodobacteraceae bacterium F11138]|nr:AraC family transcriptional regulator [Rhodobacteraceae bacterium F11138]
MAITTSAFAHALVSAAGFDLSEDGDIRDGKTVLYKTAPLTGGGLDDTAYLDLIGWISSDQTERIRLVTSYAETLKLDDLGALGLAVKTAPTLRGALRRMERYFRVLTETAVYRLDETQQPARLVIEGRTATHPALEFRNECALAGVVRNIHRMLRGTPQPASVSFRHPCRTDLVSYEALFGCPVIFNAAEDAITLPRQTLDLPNLLGDRALCDFFTAHLDDALATTEPQNSLGSIVFHRLSSSLNGGVPQASDLATDLGMSERTFFRNLAEEGTTFRDEIQKAQETLARDLLMNSKCSVAEVAFMTGFAEQSTFGRAFKRWSGLTPAKFRAHSRALAATPAAILAGRAQSLAGAADTGPRPAF